MWIGRMPQHDASPQALSSVMPIGRKPQHNAFTRHHVNRLNATTWCISPSIMSIGRMPQHNAFTRHHVNRPNATTWCIPPSVIPIDWMPQPNANTDVTFPGILKVGHSTETTQTPIHSFWSTAGHFITNSRPGGICYTPLYPYNISDKQVANPSSYYQCQNRRDPDAPLTDKPQILTVITKCLTHAKSE